MDLASSCQLLLTSYTLHTHSNDANYKLHASTNPLLTATTSFFYIRCLSLPTTMAAATPHESPGRLPRKRTAGPPWGHNDIQDLVVMGSLPWWVCASKLRSSGFLWASSDSDTFLARDDLSMIFVLTDIIPPTGHVQDSL